MPMSRMTTIIAVFIHIIPMPLSSLFLLIIILFLIQQVIRSRISPSRIHRITQSPISPSHLPLSILISPLACCIPTDRLTLPMEAASGTSHHPHPAHPVRPSPLCPLSLYIQCHPFLIFLVLCFFCQAVFAGTHDAVPLRTGPDGVAVRFDLGEGGGDAGRLGGAVCLSGEGRVGGSFLKR